MPTSHQVMFPVLQVYMVGESKVWECAGVGDGCEEAEDEQAV